MVVHKRVMLDERRTSRIVIGRLAYNPEAGT